MTDVANIKSNLPKLETLPEEARVDDVSLTETAIQSSEVFRPTEYQCRIKQRLWSRFEPSLDATRIEDLSKAAMVRITGCSSIPQWAKHPGFISWLVNPNVHDEKLAFLEHLSFEGLEDILRNNDPKAASARHQAIRTVLELTGKLKSKAVTSPVPSDPLPDMTKVKSEDLAKIIEVSKKGPST